jgi:hypothetical protein
MIRICAIVFLIACGKQTAAPEKTGCDTGAPGSVCIAFDPNFAGFKNWPSFDVTDLNMQNIVHTDATLTAYINKIPPKGSTEFPIGTIIVKQATGGSTPANDRTFAGVKRGGGFNLGTATAPGAVNWEWFELQQTDTDTPTIVGGWRGVGPPSSADVYGGDPALCNGCHVQAKANDFIWSDKLQLSNF